MPISVSVRNGKIYFSIGATEGWRGMEFTLTVESARTLIRQLQNALKELE